MKIHIVTLVFAVYAEWYLIAAVLSLTMRGCTLKSKRHEPDEFGVVGEDEYYLD